MWNHVSGGVDTRIRDSDSLKVAVDVALIPSTANRTGRMLLKNGRREIQLQGNVMIDRPSIVRAVPSVRSIDKRPFGIFIGAYPPWPCTSDGWSALLQR